MRSSALALASLSLLALAACSPSAPTRDEAMDGHDHEHVTLHWRLEDQGTDATGMQTSAVSLAIDSSAGTEVVALGTYAGCGEETMPEDGPLMTLKCWWAGGGDEFQVRMDGTTTLAIDHRILDEMVAIPDFSPYKSATIPAGAEILVDAMVRG